MTEAARLAGRAGHWAALVRRRGRAAGAGARAGARRRACWGAQGGRQVGCAAGLGVRAAGGAQVRGARQAGGARGRPGRWVRGLATGCALGLFSVRFDSVLFLSRFLDIVHEPGS